MKLKINILIMGICFTLPFYAQVDQTNADILSVMALMSDQERAWNQGDINAFMKGYWDNDRLVFTGANGPTYGYQNTLRNYKKRYPNQVAMGQLKFDILFTKQWDAQTIQLIGRYLLQREKDQPTGFFTLLFRKIEGHWKIVSDHSSSEN
ncbi:MAG: YybH family protein [Flavobacteriaceae bacterium]